jgi:hypothetical protein
VLYPFRAGFKSPHSDHENKSEKLRKLPAFVLFTHLKQLFHAVLPPFRDMLCGLKNTPVSAT